MITEEQKATRAAEREAQRKAERDAYIQKVLADCPPPTDEQIWKIRKLLNLDRPKDGPRKPTAYEIERRRQDSERTLALREAQKAALSLTACDVCNLQPDEHNYANRFRIDAHEWTPGRADKILKNSKPSKSVFVYEDEGLPHVSVGKPAPPKKRRGRPPVAVCKRGHDQTVPGARGIDGRQCLACRSIIKAANKAKRTEENNG